MRKVRKVLRIGLIGDRDSRVTAHWAIPLALQQSLLPHAGALRLEWLDTERLANGLALDAYSGFWCTPGSPYRSTEGALRAITYARTRGVPYLGTCAGFQHALLERARNVLGWDDAAHGEDGSIRALEASDHPFFVATLFQPERKALAGVSVPLAEAFLRAANQYARSAA